MIRLRPPPAEDAPSSPEFELADEDFDGEDEEAEEVDEEQAEEHHLGDPKQS